MEDEHEESSGQALLLALAIVLVLGLIVRGL